MTERVVVVFIAIIHLFFVDDSLLYHNLHRNVLQVVLLLSVIKQYVMVSTADESTLEFVQLRQYPQPETSWYSRHL
jgi:hypothetical protein